MPELPEVETITRTLNNQALPGAVISSANVFWERSIAEPAVDDFIQRIAGQKIESIGRRGKFIVITLERDFLVIHLRMSGDIRLENVKPGNDRLPGLEKHDRLVLNLEDGRRVVFSDPRKFGRVWLVKNPLSVTGKIGLEPFDERLTPEYFFDRLRTRKRQVKPLLMDQTFLAGMGNIYTDEALYRACIHPNKRSDTITIEQAEHLLSAIRSVLKEGIARNGASIDWVYRGGDFQNTFGVYQRTGLPCAVCGSPIQRIVVAQRGTHFCPSCQPED